MRRGWPLRQRVHRIVSAEPRLADWLSQGPYAPYVRDRRMVSSIPMSMLDITQPAGDFPDPPVRELCIIQDKSGTHASVDFGAGRNRFNPGSIAAVPCMSATQVTVENAHNIRVLGIAPENLLAWTEQSSATVDLGHMHSTGTTSPFMHQLLDRIWDAGALECNAPALYADAALLTLWAELLREAKRPVKDSSRGGLAPWQIRRCTEYLSDHAGENVGLATLAALVNLSPFHFSRAFKHSLGMPPYRYQLKLRMERARVLLEMTNAPITEIAFDVGYESSQALARLFRREVGVSPSEYRRDRLT